MKPQVQRTGDRRVRRGLGLPALDVQIDLLTAKAQCLAAVTEMLQLHAEQFDMELHTGAFIDGRHGEVIQMLDHAQASSSGK